MNPIYTVDAIIKYKNKIVAVERSKPPFGLALPGGHVEENETLEQAIEREAKEETNLKLANLKQFHTYSELDRDPRYRAISTVFTADGYGELKAGSDAKTITLISLNDIDNLDFTFDHYRILSDYKRGDYSNQVVSKIFSPQEINDKQIWEILWEGHFASQYYDDEPRRPETIYVNERLYVLANSIDEALEKSKSHLRKIKKYYGKKGKDNEKITASPFSLDNLFLLKDYSQYGGGRLFGPSVLMQVQLSLDEVKKDYKLTVSLMPKKK